MITRKDKIICAISLLMIIIMLAVGGWSDVHYSTTAKVYEQNEKTTIMVDAAGYLWEVIDRPDLKVDDIVTIKFFNNGTDYTREDDKIIKITVDK